MFIDFLLDRFRDAGDKPAVIDHGVVTAYSELLRLIAAARRSCEEAGVGAGNVVMLRADYSAAAIAALLALLDRQCIVIPVSEATPEHLDEIARIGEVESVARVTTGDALQIAGTGRTASHPLYEELRRRKHPGLVLFSSGSTGKPKGTAHDAVHLLEKFKTRRHDLCTLAFLLFDHIGGLDTLLYCLSNASTIVLPDDRTPEAVCRAIAEHRVEVLPAAPTFLTMLVLSDCASNYDLSSVKYVTYGAEVMPTSTLHRCREIFPRANLLQKYGTTEIGTMRSKSRSDDSLWVKLGGEGYAWRVVEGILQIKAHSAMLGYLNAPSPFTEDGWFVTGDAVEVDGEYVRILGRKSDMINVGGQKVYPAEVENAIRELDNVAEVTVFGERNVLMGNIIVARVQLLAPEEPAAFRVRLKKHVGATLEPHKVPVKIEIVDKDKVSTRLKKERPRNVDAADA